MDATGDGRNAFSRLKKNLRKDFSGLEPIRVALLGDSSTQFLAQALRGAGFDKGFDLRILEAGHDQMEREVFDPQSELYRYEPQVIILFHSTLRLLEKYDRGDVAAQGSLAGTRLQLIDSLCTAIRAVTTAKIIYYNYTETDDAVFGNYANKTETSFLFQLRRLNYGLMEYAMRWPDLSIVDLAGIQNQCGKAVFFRPALFINTDMVIHIDILPRVAAATVGLIGVFSGRMKKCLVLDLDNTLWGGVIGDDGLERIEIGALGIGKAFTGFQYWLKKLKNRGIILAVCSKNTESVAREPFLRHPDMVLRLEDFAVFMANWETKVENIMRIRDILNIGFDSMVFLDDSPFERNMVREALPEITVPELPEDPADFLEYLYTLHLFETAALSEEDVERTRLYQTEAKRSGGRQQYADEDSFLQGLQMSSRVEPFNAFNGPRVAQLSQRSNQFNLRTVRYTEADIARLAAGPGVLTFSFTLADRFGDNGTIAVVILRMETEGVLFIDTWLMSCRVLKRGMENFMLNVLVEAARTAGFGWLKGEYLPTAKNEMVRDHYQGLGFSSNGGCWLLDLAVYQPRKTHIVQW